MVGSLGKVVSLIRPTAHMRGGHRTTTLKWRVVGVDVKIINVKETEKCKCCFFSTGPHHALHQPSLTLTGTPLTLNPAPKFLGVTLDRTLSFDSHVHSLRTKFFPRFKALAP